jgi:hypothetical protein
MRLDPEVKAALEEAAQKEGRSTSNLADRILRTWLVEQGYLSERQAHETAEVVLTGGNIRNGHIYLRGVSSMLPADVIGGPNASTKAPRRLTVSFEPGETVETDVAGDKMIFRARGPVSDFFRLSGAKEDDAVLIERTSDYCLTISLCPR